jgi:hypothetical protein
MPTLSTRYCGRRQKSAKARGVGMDGGVTVETDMTDIGTGVYTIIAQTAAEMMAARSGDKFALSTRLFQFPQAPVVSRAPTT